MLLFAFVITRNDRQLSIVALIAASLIAFSTPFVRTVDWFSVLPEFFAAYISKDNGSLFPVFPFSAYVFLGAAFGTVLRKVDPAERTNFIMKWGIPAGAVFVIVGYIVEHFQVDLSSTHYDVMGSEFHLFFKRAGFVLIGLTLVSFLYIKTQSLSKYYSIFGRRALFIYVGHLIILYGSAIFPSINSVYAKSLDLIPVLICVVIIELLTLSAAYFYEYTIRNYESSKKIYRIIVIIYLLFVLFI